MGCKLVSVRAPCIEGKEIKGSEGMKRLIPDLQRLPCSGRKRGCCGCGLFLCLLRFPMEGSALAMARGRRALCLLCGSGTEIPHTGKPKATIKPARLA